MVEHKRSAPGRGGHGGRGDASVRELRGRATNPGGRKAVTCKKRLTRVIGSFNKAGTYRRALSVSVPFSTPLLPSAHARRLCYDELAGPAPSDAPADPGVVCVWAGRDHESGP